MPGLRVCPISVAVFFGTAAFIAYSKKKSHDGQDDDKSKSTTRMPAAQVVFVLGAPGVGKGTQCQLLTERLTQAKWAHLSAGDLLRAERQKTGSALADEINHCIAHGQLVRSEITCQLLENAMQTAYENDGTTHFLVDGYPRSRENVDAWEKTMKHHHIRFVLDYECPEETLVGRLLERGKNSGRVDDNLETVRKRFVTFQNETAPILDFYRQSTDVPVYTIATDKGVEEVFRDTKLYFE